MENSENYSHLVFLALSAPVKRHRRTISRQPWLVPLLSLTDVFACESREWEMEQKKDPRRCVSREPVLVSKFTTDLNVFSIGRCGSSIVRISEGEEGDEMNCKWG